VRANLRAILRVATVALWFLVCAPLHIATKLITGRSPWPQRFLGTAARIIGVRVRVDGAPVRGHTLLIANHTSWLDILILAGATGCAFVSKDQLGHPFIHWLADQNDTVYVRRTHVKGAKEQAVSVAKSLAGAKPVAVFPEGTTGPGDHLLPFRSTLLEAANYAAKDVAVRPVAIDYGAARQSVGWWHESGKDNVLRLLGRRGSLAVDVHLLDPLDRAGDRKRLAHQSREAIADRLGFKLSGHSPIGAGE
jgi:1-acyl-sn-glycerol-3-phosphate acyltransferase